ncbi:uncharacterized protein LOC133928908 isoform X2 [Phragmites australis]|uniref:uncharacterized protein LOC133928908 isoform X2 n=1 Tax=Phragmites australis TaxID=29695 RepID=UPI002D7836DF|nr:uncharacterized protein LOC133928908 isoform X2 [Phragmites australis]
MAHRSHRRYDDHRAKADEPSKVAAGNYTKHHKHYTKQHVQTSTAAVAGTTTTAHTYARAQSTFQGLQSIFLGAQWRLQYYSHSYSRKANTKEDVAVAAGEWRRREVKQLEYVRSGQVGDINIRAVQVHEVKQRIVAYEWRKEEKHHKHTTKELGAATHNKCKAKKAPEHARSHRTK